MLALSVLPLVGLAVTSFQTVEWSGGGPVSHMGRANAATVRSSTTSCFAPASGTHDHLAFGAVAGQMVVDYWLAVLVSKITRGRVLYRAIFILPILIPGIVIGAIWKLMLNYDFGLAEQAAGFRRVVRTTGWERRRRRFFSVIVVDIWHWTPFCFLLFGGAGILAGCIRGGQDRWCGAVAGFA